MLRVQGLPGPVTDVNVTLGDFSHEFPDDLDVLLVAPSGDGVILMSDACGDTAPVTNVNLTFDQGAAAIPDTGPGCSDGGTFGPADHEDASGDALPNTGSIESSLDGLDGENPNGDWRLWIDDDEVHGSGGVGSGSISSWTLEIEVGSSVIQIPATGGSASANPYPSETLVLQPGGEVITDLNVAFEGLAHSSPGAIDMFLEGPGGQKAWLMSDACNGMAQLTDLDVVIDDEAALTFPVDTMEQAQCELAGSRPTNYDGNSDDFGAPAPSPPAAGATSLSAFDLTDPSGLWKLWIANDDEVGGGYVVDGYDLQFTTRAAAPAGLSPGAVTGAEGTSVFLSVVRGLVDGTAGRGEVTVATQSGTAVAGEDFVPVSQTIVFEPGETQKTVEIPILGGVPREPLQGFSVTLANAEGDVRVDTPAAAGITIPADADFDDPPPNSFDPPLPVRFTATGSTTIPSVRRCKRPGQKIRFRPRNTNGLAIVRSRVSVNGRLVEDNVGEAAIAPIVLTMQGRRMRVRVRLTSHDGRFVTINRTYRRCKPRR